MRLPDLVAYQAAVQHPATAFADPHLRAATVTTGQLGLPRAVAGNFAVTYQLRNASRQWAVRCFHREAADRASRYAAISQTLARLSGGPLVPIEYLDQGVHVGQTWYPITKMAWLDGHPLNRSVEACLNDARALRDLERRFVEVVAQLRQHGLAHGDLQHGNILVDAAGKLHLVDYDGMFVPALRGRPASESGDPNYQHPRRTIQFDAELDRFAAIVIVVALRALAIEPGLWATYNTGDNLLFRRADLAAPQSSAVFRDLARLPPMRELTQRFERVCRDDYARVPLLDDFLQVVPVRTFSPAPLKAGQAAVLNSLYGPRVPAGAPRSWKLRRASIQHSVALSGDASLLATASRDGKIVVRDAANGKTRRTLRLPRQAGTLRGVAFTPAGDVLALVSDGPTLAIWDAGSQSRIQVLTAGSAIRSVAMSADGAWVVAATQDGMLRCGRVGNGRWVAAVAPPGPVGGLAIGVDGRQVAMASGRAAVQVWHMPNGRLAASLASVRGVTCLAFTADGARLAVGTTAGRVSVWDVRSARLVQELAAVGSPLESLALSRDGGVLGATGKDGSIWVRRLSPGAVQPPPRPTPTTVHVVRLFDWIRRVAL